MKKIFLLLIILVCQSCAITGLTNDYSKLTPTQKTTIIPLDNFENLSQKNIYKITATQLKEELAKHPKSLVYVFSNGCTSELCKPMNIYENYAKRNGYQLFLVMNGYGNLEETLDQRDSFSSNLFSINNEYYPSRFRGVYTQYFENELTNKPMKEKAKEYEGSLFFFENGNLEKVLYELPEG